MIKEKTTPMNQADNWLTCQYQKQAHKTSGKGHYESYFIRANHPSEAKAFWVRYTIFAPKEGSQPMTEMWAIFFDAETEGVVAVQKDIPWQSSSISDDYLHLNFDGAKLDSVTPRSGRSIGDLHNKKNRLAWEVEYAQGGDPVLLLPEKLYSTPLPKAKSLIISPNALFNGKFIINGQSVAIENWQGSINHNWGSKHTDAYAWGQVAGFDNDENAFFECATARIKLGPVWTPALSLAVLQVGGKTYEFNKLIDSARNTGIYNEFTWSLGCQNGDLRLQVEVRGKESDFVALKYKNPPGGIKTCLNSKVARCEVLLYQGNQEIARLHTTNRAAFEILTDNPKHSLNYGN